MADQETLEHVRRLVAAGEVSAACSLLHACYASDVRRFVASLRPPVPVQDLCQETWIAVLGALPQFRFEVSPRVWLFSIARRRTVDALRRNRKRSLEVHVDVTEVLLGAIPLRRGPTTPSSGLVRKRRAAVLDTVLAQWDSADRELLELRFVAGFKPAEIAGMLAHVQTPNAVAQRLLRLASRLRSQLQRHHEFADG